MTIARELVTILRYSLDKSGLSEYLQAASLTAKDAASKAKWFATEIKLGVQDGVREWRNLPPQISRAEREQRRLNQAAHEHNRSVKSTGQQYNSLGATIRQAFGGYLGYQGIKGFFLAGDEFGQTEARLKNATQGAEEFLRVDKALAANSRESYKPFAANAELFIRTNDVLKALGKTTDDTLDVVSATNLSLTASGADAQKAASFIDQFGKSLGMGKLDGQAFQSMLKNNQTMIKYLVAGLKETNPALGATMANFQKLVKQGKITTDVMIPALRSQMGQMRKDVEDMPVSIGDALTVFRDKLGRTSWEFEKQTGAINKATKALGFLADNLKTALRLLWLVGASWGIRRLTASLALASARTGGLLRSLVLAGKVALGLGSAMSLRNARGAIGILAAFRRTLGPMLRLMAVFETIRLIGEDISYWWQGNLSYLGKVIGRSSEWKDEIGAVKEFLTAIKNLLGGAGEDITTFAKKWGTIALLVFGVHSALRLVGVNLVSVGKLIVTRMLWPLAGVVGVIIGLPALVVIAIAAAAALVVAYWDEIKAGAKELWKDFTDGASQSLADIKRDALAMFDWFGEKGDELKKLFADMAPDWLKWLGDKTVAGIDSVKGFLDFNPSPGTMQAGTRSLSTTSSQKAEINIYGVPVNPAAVGRAAEQGVKRAFGSEVPNAPNWGPPNVEAAP